MSPPAAAPRPTLAPTEPNPVTAPAPGAFDADPDAGPDADPDAGPVAAAPKPAPKPAPTPAPTPTEAVVPAAATVAANVPFVDNLPLGGGVLVVDILKWRPLLPKTTAVLSSQSELGSEKPNQ